MPMYSLIEYSKNYGKTTSSLWNYYRDEPNDFPANNYNTNSITNSESFKYKSSITGKDQMQTKKTVKALSKETQILKKNLKIIVPLKHLSIFRRTLDMPLINCEVSLTLVWSDNCVITTQADITALILQHKLKEQLKEITQQNQQKMLQQMQHLKLYVPVVTLSTENDKRLLEQLRTGFKRIIKWNKYRSETTNQAKNSNLNYLNDSIFTKVNRLFVLSFENENDRTSFSKYYVLNVQIEEFNVLIDGKSFFDMAKKHTSKLSK